jgi:hypothetical protein
MSRRSTRERHEIKRFRFSEFRLNIVQPIAPKKKLLQRAIAEKKLEEDQFPSFSSSSEIVPGKKDLDQLKSFIKRTGGFPVENDMDANSSDSFFDDDD